jgi:hypothetical protein
MGFLITMPNLKDFLKQTPNQDQLNEPSSLLWTNNNCIDKIKWLQLVS